MSNLTVEQIIFLVGMLIVGWGGCACFAHGWIKGEKPVWMFRLMTPLCGIVGIGALVYLFSSRWQ